ncbi:molybdopterin molybdenumtransferase MoeA [Halonotius terrestris]|uniref:Molybdopterin molybdenumtransferase MoeA n=1 Tax=Halonotius terrestris TaxID=2487750 RepID=A0A8J8PBY4_9EURY|nr:gephyrin-like molybdotransferase Glp [Halonotius terrestris]TQQ81222.1 molybdopterin molybdenumtransferase MoeA [Halonotius terrestris]
MPTEDRRRAGFKQRTRLAAAREQLLSAVTPHDRTERLRLSLADGRVVATELTAPTPVPNYDRAAMDGYAVRANDTVGASSRSPEVLDALDAGADCRPNGAVPVHTGSEIPDGADAVVKIEETEAVGNEIEVFAAVAEGTHVGPVGEDVAEGQSLYEPGHRLRPSDLGLLKSVGCYEIEVYQEPTVGVVPTGEELVEHEPEPGEIIETNGLTVSQLVDRWGGVATYRNTVTDDTSALRAAIQRDLTKDVIVTTGGSSVGERDLLPEVVDELGEVLVHGVAIKPGYPVALGVVQETPVLMLPGNPVACIVTAMQFLRPALKRAGHMAVEPVPTQSATLARKLPSEPGTRTFARVETSDAESGDERTATPVRTGGAGILSSVALADGWVVVPEDREGYSAGETVDVERWEVMP